MVGVLFFMKISKNKLNLTDKIIEDYEANFYDSKEIILDLLREYLYTMTIARLNDLYGYTDEESDNC
jgi:hypothetical protein